MDTIIRIIKPNTMRYITPGDYFIENGKQIIEVADTGNDKYNLLIALHELVELNLCADRGIKEEDISKFDIDFEENREEDNNDEPGNDPKAPYYQEHQFATFIEKKMASQLNVDWVKYSEVVDNLDCNSNNRIVGKIDNKQLKIPYMVELYLPTDI